MSVSRVAIVGAGPQALSIAEAVAEAELPVTVVCITGDREELAARRLQRTLQMRVDMGELSEDDATVIAARISLTRDLREVGGCDLVIESAVGDNRMRRALLATVESHVSRGAVLASNVSRSRLPSMAEVLVRPDQFLGLRFLHPASHTPVVEVTALEETAPGAHIACETLCRWLGKTPVAQVDGDVEPVPRPRLAAAE